MTTGDPKPSSPEKKIFTKGYIEPGLKRLQELEPGLAAKIEGTIVGSSHSFTPEEIEKLAQTIPDDELGSFLSGYASQRWKSDSIEWQGEDGKWHQENNAAGCWWRLTPQERLEFYLNSSREEAEQFFAKKTGIKIKMMDRNY